MKQNISTQKINNEHTSATSGQRPYKVIVIGAFLAIVFLVLIGIIIYLLNNADKNRTNRVVKVVNVEEIQEQLSPEDYVPTGAYKVNMNTNWVFPDGNSPSSNAYISNDAENLNTVYFTITPASDPDMILYTSPMLTPGSKLNDITLDKPLSVGIYQAILTYHLVDDDEQEISTVAVNLTISVDK